LRQDVLQGVHHADVRVKLGGPALQHHGGDLQGGRGGGAGAGCDDGRRVCACMWSGMGWRGERASLVCVGLGVQQHDASRASHAAKPRTTPLFMQSEQCQTAEQCPHSPRRWTRRP
jgi:hypothetical protein